MPVRILFAEPDEFASATYAQCLRPRGAIVTTTSSAMNNIVLTDGSSTFTEFLRQELEDEGYHVQLAHDAQEVTAMLQQKISDIMILGTSASINTGMAVVEQIRAMHPGTPIILFVSCDDAYTQDDRSRFATACVEKSDDLTTLKRVLSKIVPKTQSGERLRFGLPPTIRE